MSLDRYRSIVPEWDQLLERSGVPEPVTIRIRSGRIQADALAARLQDQGFHLERHPHLPEFFQLHGDGPYSLGVTLEHWAGLFYVQQSVMALPSLALGASPGERVLDLCAAPGGKTGHLAELMDDRGCLIASDVKEKRLRVLMANLKRLGHLNVVTIAADGTTFPTGARFDRVLVDAPCSGEGNLRSRGGRLPNPSAGFRRKIAETQERLLRRAVSLVRPGGVVIYSTCTFAPEENEAVVDAVLQTERVTVEPIDLDIPHDPGLRSHEGRDYSEELTSAWRVYPHHLDSGGLFMVRLRKLAEDDRGEATGWRVVPEVYDKRVEETRDPSPKSLADESERFFEGFSVSEGPLLEGRWFSRGDAVWAHGCDRWPIEGWHVDGSWRFLAIGLRAFELESGGRARPSNDLLTLLGSALGSRVVSVSRAELTKLLDGASIPVRAAGLRGYVALAFDGVVLGRGIVRSGNLESQIPKARSRALADILRRTAPDAD